MSIIRKIIEEPVVSVIQEIIPEPSFDPFALLPEFNLDSRATVPFDDQTGNGNNFVAFGGTPVVDPVGINGFPALNFAGAASLVRNALITPSTSDATIYIVLKMSTVGSDQCLYTQMKSFGTIDVNYSHEHFINKNLTFFHNPSTPTSSVRSNFNLSANVGYINTLLYDQDGNTTMKTNNANAKTLASGTYSGTALFRTFIGRRNNLRLFTGFIGEIFVFNKLLSAAEDLQMFNYLKDRWAIV